MKQSGKSRKIQLSATIYNINHVKMTTNFMLIPF